MKLFYTQSKYMEKVQRLPSFAWILAITFVGLPLVKMGVGFLLFHYLVENMTILVSLLLYMLAYRTYKFTRNSLVLFIGVTYFYAAMLGLLHIMTYKGMNLIPEISANISTQYWLARRFMETIGVLLATYMGKKEISPTRLHLGFGFAFALVIASISLGIFPVCYVEGSGLTLFKKISEYAILAIGAATLFRLRREKSRLGVSYASYLGGSIAVGMAAELCFTLYINVFDLMNVAGHLLYFASSGFIGVFVIREGLDRPYQNIFTELYQRSIRDPLTGLFNRNGLGEMAEKMFERAKRIPAQFVLLFIDIDDFKKVNDIYGHPEGDLALNEFGKLLRGSFREYDIIARMGGDEFVVLLEEMNHAPANVIPEARLRSAVEAWTKGNARRAFLGVTIGQTSRAAGSEMSLEEMIALADAELVRRKSMKAGSMTGNGLSANLSSGA